MLTPGNQDHYPGSGVRVEVLPPKKKPASFDLQVEHLELCSFLIYRADSVKHSVIMSYPYNVCRPFEATTSIQ
jgi:hypothetical protein